MLASVAGLAAGASDPTETVAEVERAVMRGSPDRADAAADVAAGGDAIELRAGGLLIDAVRIEAIGAERVRYRAAGGRGWVPLAAVRRLRFAGLPELGEAEARATRGDPGGAAGLLAPVARRGEGAAADWAAVRCIEWLGPIDPAGAATVAAERLRRDGRRTWLDRLRAATETADPEATPTMDAAAARDLLRRIRRWRGMAAPGSVDPDVAFDHHVAPLGVRDEVDRGLAAIGRWADGGLRAARASSSPPRTRPVTAAGGSLEPGRGRGGAAGPAEPIELRTAADVARALAAGHARRVIAALGTGAAPPASSFGPGLLRRLAEAAEAAERPAAAAAAWLRLAVLHPRTAESDGAWAALAELHETALDDPEAARRIRRRAREAGRMATGRVDPSGESRG